MCVFECVWKPRVLLLCDFFSSSFSFLPGNFVSFHSKYQQMFVVFCGKDKIRNRQTVGPLTQLHIYKKPSSLGHIAIEFQARDAYMPLIAGMCASLELIMEYSPFGQTWSSSLCVCVCVHQQRLHKSFVGATTRETLWNCNAKVYVCTVQYLWNENVLLFQGNQCVTEACSRSSSSRNATIKSHSQFQ